MCLLVAFQCKGQAPPPNMQHHWVRFRPQFKYGRHPNSKDSFHLQGKIWFGVHKNNMIRLKIYSWHRETATLSSQFTTHVRINAITLTLWSLTRQHIFIISLEKRDTNRLDWVCDCQPSVARCFWLIAVTSWAHCSYMVMVLYRINYSEAKLSWVYHHDDEWNMWLPSLPNQTWLMFGSDLDKLILGVARFNFLSEGPAH